MGRRSFFYAVLATASILPRVAMAQVAQTPTPTPVASEPGAQRAPDDAGVGDIIVTAQRRSEPLQTVPVAITALTGAQLEARQLRSVTDLQFQVPNVSFTQGPFGGSNLQVRGVGTLLVNGEAGVGIHYNDVFIGSPRLTESEYYDLADVEVLRGPQGTLFGRNSTGGVLNIKTQPAVLNEFQATGQVQLGNYNDRRVNGAVNIPLIGDTLAVRVAGIYLDRDGYTTNINTGRAIDGRTQYSVRGSLTFKPAEGTTFTLVGSYFNEDSTRLRFQKQLCVRDPSGVLGCLPDGLATQPTNSISSGAGLTSDVFLRFALGRPDLGLVNFFDPPISANPSSYRQVNQAFDPQYRTDETFVSAQLQQELTDALTVTVLGGYQRYKLNSASDFQSAVFGNITLPDAFFTYKPAAAAFLNLSPGDSAPTSDNGPCGVACGGVQSTNGLGLQDVATGSGKQYSVEARITSSFDGPFNFQAAAYYLTQRNRIGLSVVEPFLDYAAMMLAGPDPSSTVFATLLPSRFESFTPRVDLDSLAFFGEAYLKLNDQLKLTVGLRRTHDSKRQVSRQALLSIPVQTDILTGLASYVAADGTRTSSRDEADLLAAAVAAGAIDFDPSQPGAQLWADQRLGATAYTGRAVLDYTADLSFTDQTLIYASYSRGYKAGGFNPPADPLLNLGAPQNYGSESINAFELGTKNLLFGRKVRLNLTAFYYDYSGLQIGTINNRTSYTSNVDTTIYGAEAEFAVSPTRRLQLDGSVSYLRTKLGDASSIDPRNPSQSRADADLIKDLFSNGNCVVLANGNPSIEDNSALLASLNSNGGFYLPTGSKGVPYLPAGAPASGVPTTPGIAHSAFSSCAALAANTTLAAQGYQVYASGLPVSLKGNELPNSPHWSLALGAQYDLPLSSSGIHAIARVDYTWRDHFFGTQYNAPRDQVKGYDQVNLSATLYGTDDRWYVRGFVQNLTDNTNVIGLYNSDPGSGLYTNAFLAPPRLYGVAIGGKF